MTLMTINILKYLIQIGDDDGVICLMDKISNVME